MPELPEVETIRRQLNEVLPGQVITDLEIVKAKSFIGDVHLIKGKKILSVERRAKILRINLVGNLNLLVHLKMTGQLIYVKTQNSKLKTKKPDRIVGGHPTADWVGSLPSTHTRISLKLTKGILYFNDQRMFGWVKVVAEGDLEKEHLNFGPDIIDTKIVTPDYFYNAIHHSRSAIKLVILDQKKMAGGGNIYANDGLFLAGVNPRRPAATLSKKEAKALLSALCAVMVKGLALGGASETNFLHVDGMGGKYQEHFLVYKKNGEECPTKNCKGVIRKVQLGGRGTYFCPICQK